MMRELDLTEDDLRRQLRATEPPERSQRKQPLEIISAQESFRRVRERGPRKYLISPIWPEKTYGATGAEDKAGKSWDQADAGISVATGTPYLNRFPTAVGPVLLFQGEGSEEMFTRRAKAIIEDRGGTESDLDLLRVCYRAPGLTNREHLAQIDAELREFRPILVGIDPLYLSAAGAKGSDLYGMGELFRPIQEITEGAGSALRVTTHWNKTGTGTGPQRFTGVGPGAWGRVLGSASVEKRRTLENGGSEVLLKWEYMGSEISETHFFMRRRVWVDDPNDLNSPMHYSVEVKIGRAHV